MMEKASKPESVDIDKCHWYHTVDVPGVGLCEGEWDLRETVHAYLGDHDFGGKSVLECGPGSGTISQFLAPLVKSLTVLDLSVEGEEWDVVPFHQSQEDRIKEIKGHLEMAQNAFWLNYIKNESTFDVYHSSIYKLDALDAQFDVTVLGAILIHLRDPLKALELVAKKTSETIIITELYPRTNLKMKFLYKLGYSFEKLIDYCDDTPHFLPEHRKPGEDFSWWSMPPQFYENYLRILGFNRFEKKVSDHVYQKKPVRMYTLVASR